MCDEIIEKVGARQGGWLKLSQPGLSDRASRIN